MLVLPFFSELDWEAYIVSIAKIATKKLGSLICSMFLSSRLVFFSINLLSGFKSVMRFPKSNKKKKEIGIFFMKAAGWQKVAYPVKRRGMSDFFNDLRTSLTCNGQRSQNPPLYLIPSFLALLRFLLL